MADFINYDFANNHATLELVQGHIAEIQSARDDINQMFSTLAATYEGDGYAALMAAQAKVGTMLDEAIDATARTQQQAADQQDAMKAMDAANAAAF